MRKRDFLKSMGAAAATLSTPRALFGQRTGARKPNVVLVMTDDQGYGDLSCHGNADLQTPNLDRLYSDSVRLTNFHVDPTCSPTRSSLMTGRYSSRTGVWHTIMGRSILRADEVTMADVFAAGGYRTAIFGKWHLGDNYPYRPQDRGFDEVLIHGGGGVGQGPDYFGNDYFDDTYCHNGQWKPFKGYCTDVWFEGALRFIEQHKDEPFFVYLPTNAAHGPFNVAEKYSQPFVDKGVPRNRAKFYGMIVNIDENMGRLRQKLDDLGLADDTILIFMTDNGTSGGLSGPYRAKKGSEYEGGHRVPFFVHWPGGGLSGGHDVDRLTAHIDVLPTLAELCGVAPPERVKLDGASLAPLLAGRDAEWPERTLFVHSQRLEHPEKWRKSAVMTDRWRLVNGKELYDVNADPGQKKDLAADNPEVVEQLRAEYDDWWDGLATRFDEYVRLVLGADEENPTRLMSHDWHCRNPAWSQGAVRNAARSNGFWAVEVAKPGTYEFELRRWPREVDQPITASIEGGKAIRATHARLRIAGFDETRPIPDGARVATFEAELEPCRTRVETWFTDEASGESRGAYYVYVRRRV